LIRQAKALGFTLVKADDVELVKFGHAPCNCSDCNPDGMPEDENDMSQLAYNIGTEVLGRIEPVSGTAPDGKPMNVVSFLVVGLGIEH